MAETIGVMGPQQLLLSTADTWYVVVAPAAADRAIIEAEAAGRIEFAGEGLDGQSVPAWGAGSGVRGYTMPAATATEVDLRGRRRLALASDGGASSVAITFLDRVR